MKKKLAHTSENEREIKSDRVKDDDDYRDY